MQSEIFANQEKMHEIALFLRQFGVKAFETYKGQDRVVEVLDERVEECKISYSFKVEEEGKKVVIVAVGLVTPTIMLSVTDTIHLIVNDFATKRDLIELILHNVIPNSFFINGTLFSMLVKYPGIVVGYGAIVGRTELSHQFLDTVADDLWKCEAKLTEVEDKRLHLSAEKIAK
jgi:hypothetical protein